MPIDPYYDIAMLSDIQISPEGDFVLADLYPSIEQDLAHWMELSKAELVWENTFFSDIKKHLSKQMTSSNLNAVRSRVEDFLKSDPRVSVIESITVIPNTDNHSLSVVAKVDGVELFAQLNP